MLCSVNCSKKSNHYLGLGKQILMIGFCLFLCAIIYRQTINDYNKITITIYHILQKPF